jgi:hypothetical protein
LAERLGLWYELGSIQRACSRCESMKNLYLLLAIVFLVIGLGSMFIGHDSSTTLAIVEGICKGLAGVFFILYYIFMLLGKQPQDKTSSH